MMRSHSTYFPAALTALALVVAACDDDDPVGGNNAPCDDANVACLTLTLNPADMTYESTYSPLLDRTEHVLRWDVDPAMIAGYAPGRRVMVTVNFSPPVRARMDHNSEAFRFGAGDTTSCHDRWSDVSASVSSTEWTTAGNDVVPSGECDSGEPSVTVTIVFAAIDENDELRRIRSEFTVPSTYTDGPNQGTPVLPGDLEVFRIELSAPIPGDTRQDPPAWQGEFTDFQLIRR